MTYNPFDKPIYDLIASDLDLLVSNHVTEGYWVEYKSVLVEKHKIAKSIASFANSYGGWYFIGVEANNTNNEAISIAGFSLADFPRPIDKIRDIIKSRINPIPFFQIKLIELGNNKAVLVVYVPDEQDTPFILTDGCIYRRNGDSSDPIKENERATLDKLVEKGRQSGLSFERFCQDSRSFSEAETNGWVNIFLEPYPLNPIKIDKTGWYTNDKQKQLIELSYRPIPILDSDGSLWGTGNTPLDSVQQTTKSIILRQATHPFGVNALTIEIFYNGRVRFFIPLQVIHNGNQEITSTLQSEEVKKTITSSLQSPNYRLLKFFNIGTLWVQITNLYSYYQTVINQFFPNENITNFRYAISLDNVWRYTPFVDHDAWVEYTEETDFPVMNYQNVFLPSFPQKYFQYERKTSAIWYEIALLTCIEFGLPGDLIQVIPLTIQKQSLPNES